MARLAQHTLGNVLLIVVDADPNTVETAPAGSLATQTSGKLWINTDGVTTWTEIGAGGGGGGLLDDGVIASNQLSPWASGYSLATGPTVANKIIYIPFKLSEARTIDKIVATMAPSSTPRDYEFGIYTRAGSRQEQTGQFQSATSQPEIVDVSPNWSLSAGGYYLACWTNYAFSGAWTHWTHANQASTNNFFKSRQAGIKVQSSTSLPATASFSDPATTDVYFPQVHLITT